MKKRILFLGAAPTQLPPIKYAREQGHYIITCDYLPENPGHKLADEWHNISTTNKEEVLSLAKSLKIDGVVAYASDPAAPTAAYVAEAMGIPGNPYSSVEILAKKDLFRKFLSDNNFNVPSSRSFTDIKGAMEWVNEIGLPVYVKPVDSSGSKGVTCLKEIEKLQDVFNYAMSFSREKRVVIEKEIIKYSYQVAGDGFIVNGKLVFRCWADEHFDKLCNGLVPIGQSFPTSHSSKWLETAHSETQRLLDLLGMKHGALNFDFVFDKNGKFYFLELGPRNGGCLIPEVIKYATSEDLIKYTVDSAIGLQCDDLKMTETKGFWSSYMVHSLKDGFFKELWLSDKVKSKIIEQDIWVKVGDKVNKYLGSHNTLGTMIIQYESMQEMLEMIDNMEHDIRVIIK